MNLDLQKIIEYINLNDGVITILIFVITLVFGWISGIFKFMSHKPKLIVDNYSSQIIPFYVSDNLPLSTNIFEDRKVGRTIFIIGLSISNIGFVDTSIKTYKLTIKSESGKTHVLIPMSLPKPLSCSLKDGEFSKVFPSLTTSYPHLGHSTSWEISIGRNIVGFLYFNIEYYGDYVPKRSANNKIEGHIIIEDIYGKEYKKKVLFEEKDVTYLGKFITPDDLINQPSYEI